MEQINNLFHVVSEVGPHLQAQKENYQPYLSFLVHCINTDVNLAVGPKSAILAASLIRHDHPLTYYLLTKGQYLVPEILKTCEILDTNRLVVSLERRIAFLETHAKRKRLLRDTRLRRNNLLLNQTAEVEGCSLTSSRIKRLIQWWVSRIPEDKLFFYALTYDMGSWKKLSNYLHLKPSDFTADWFLDFAHHGTVPEGSQLEALKEMNGSLTAYIKNHRPDYSFLRAHHYDKLTDVDKVEIIGYIEPEMGLWYWEELRDVDRSVDQLLNQRLKGVNLKMPYGKLMDRLLTVKQNAGHPQLMETLMQIAETRLNEINLQLNQPVLVLGDASGSMQVAVNTATIIASLLTALVEARLHFFKNVDIPINIPPYNVESVLKLTEEIVASHTTVPAASLYPYYEKKEVVKTIVVVTDEIENGSVHGDNFAHLYRKYHDEVYPARLVFITFKKNDNDGRMVANLRDMFSPADFENKVIQFRMDPTRPDLSRLDTIFNRLMAQEGVDVPLVDPKEVLVNPPEVGKHVVKSKEKPQVPVICIEV